MSGSLEILATSLRATEGYVNDHDHICDCRPVDVRLALKEIKRLEAINAELLAACKALRECQYIAGWDAPSFDTDVQMQADAAIAKAEGKT